MAVSGGMRGLQTPPRALPRKAPARLRAQEASKLAGEQTTQTPHPYHPTAPTRARSTRVRTSRVPPTKSANAGWTPTEAKARRCGLG